MSWFFEGPWPILLTGLLLEVILVIAAFRTQNLKLLWWIGGAAVFVGLLLVAERFVVTDNERIAATLNGIGTAAEANNLDAILRLVAADATPVRDLATRSLAQLTIQEARIGGDLNIDVHDQADPPTAEASFIGNIRAHPRRDLFGLDRYAGRFKVGLVKQNDQWLVTSVDYSQAGRQHK